MTSWTGRSRPVPFCSGLSALAFSFVVARWLHARRRRLPSRELGRSCVVTVATTVVLWLPPVLDELTRKRGNLTILLEHFRNPPEPLVGLGPAVPHVLGHLDVWFLLTESMRHPGHLRAPMSEEPTVTGGAITMVLWLVSAALALRVRERNLLALHATVAAALGIALIAAARIVGFPHKYVLLFGWSMGGLTLLSIAWTMARLVQKRARSSAIPRRVAAVFGLALIGTFAARLTARVRDAGSGDPTSALQLGTLVAPTVQAIRGRVGASVGTAGPYLVTWEDALYGGGHGYALLNELERHGIRAFISDGAFFRSVVGAHRVIEPKRARARIHIANGDWIFEARKMRGATEIAYSDIRTPTLRKEYDECVANLAQALRDLGRADMIPRIERHVGSTNVPGLGWGGLIIARISEIGMPEAVFVLPK